MKFTTYLAILATLLLVGCSTKQHQNLPVSTVTEADDFSTLNLRDNYRIADKQHGTETQVLVQDGKRIITTNALPNHETGEFPNPGNPNTIRQQNRTYSLPVHPKLTGESRWAREPGVAVNGIKFEPETAERFVCETGEVYRIEAMQDLVDMGLDHNHAHVQPTGAYHYHGVPTKLVEKLDNGNDILLIGYAKDGFPMYYSKRGKYKPSYALSKDLRTGEVCNYRNPHQAMEKVLDGTQPDGTFVSDWTYVEGLGELDECNGIEVDGAYGYFVTDEYPYVGRCLKGEFTERHPPGPPPGGHRHGGRG